MKENNVLSCDFINGVGRNDRPYKAIQFHILTSEGEWSSDMIFLRGLEANLVEKALSSIN